MVFKDSNDYAKFYEYGKRRYAMVYVPKEPIEPRVGIFLFNGGRRYRSGSHNVHVKIGVELASRGIYVIASDPKDQGDVFEKFNYSNIYLHYYSLHKEVEVKDAGLAVNYFKDELKLDRVVLSGHCGGARTAIGCAYRYNNADSLFAWCAPFYMASKAPLVEDTTGVTAPPKSDQTPEKETSRKKSSRLFTVLGKLVRLQVDWRYQYNKMERRLYKSINKNSSFDYREAREIDAILRRNVDMEFVYSEKDIHYTNFVNYYLPTYGKKKNIEEKTHVLKDSNHVVGDLASQQILYDLMHKFCLKTAQNPKGA